jgi:hypothetical protein
MPLEATGDFDGHALRSLPEGVEGHIVSCWCIRLIAEMNESFWRPFGMNNRTHEFDDHAMTVGGVNSTASHSGAEAPAIPVSIWHYSRFGTDPLLAVEAEGSAEHVHQRGARVGNLSH